MYSTEIKQNKQVCRLCCYETTDTVNIYSDKGKEFDYEGKINKYLYLYVSVKVIRTTVTDLLTNTFTLTLRLAMMTIYQRQYVGCVHSIWKPFINSTRR